MIVASRIAFIIGLLLLPAVALGDEGMWWNEVGIRHRPIKKLRLDLDQHLRFDFGPVEVASVMPEGSVLYDFKSWLRVQGGYRFIKFRNRFDRFETWHRFFADLRLRGKWHKVRLTNRLRFQEQITSEFGQQDRHTIRNEVKLGYDTDFWLEPLLSLELFYRLGGRFDTGLHKYRIEIGITGEAGDHDYNVLYRLEKPVADDNDPTLHILSFSYHFSI